MARSRKEGPILQETVGQPNAVLSDQFALENPAPFPLPLVSFTNKRAGGDVAEWSKARPC